MVTMKVSIIILKDLFGRLRILFGLPNRTGGLKCLFWRKEVIFKKGPNLPQFGLKVLYFRIELIFVR